MLAMPDVAEPPNELPSNDPWTIFMAKGISKMARPLETSLMSRQLLTYYCEWCSTERPAVGGVAYPDIAFIYYPDDKGTPCEGQ